MKPLKQIYGTRVFILEGNSKLTDDIGTLYDVAINKDDGSFWTKDGGNWEKKFNFSLGNNIPVTYTDTLFPLKFINNLSDITNTYNIYNPQQQLNGFPLFFVCLNNPNTKKIKIQNGEKFIIVNGVFKTGKVFKIEGPNSEGEYIALQPDQ